MGGCFGKEDADPAVGAHDVPPLPGTTKERPTKNYVRPKWKANPPMTEEELKAKREVFWDTQPHYGGDRIIWDTLKAACETPDFDTAKVLIESAGIIVASSDMTICYDERGAKYEIPKFCLSDPTNLAPASS